MGQRLSISDRLVDPDSSGVLLLSQEGTSLQYSFFHRFFHSGSELGVVNLTPSPNDSWPLPYCWDEFHDMCEAAHKAHMQYSVLSRSSGRSIRSARFVPLIRSCFKSKAEAYEILYLGRIETAAFFHDSVRRLRLRTWNV
jgi:hypothetical protein